MVKIELGGIFHFSYQTFSKKHPELLKKVAQRVKWFKKNPDDTRLKNHALRRRMRGRFAFWITEDIRIVYEWLGKNTVRFLAIGDHKTVYSKK